MYLIKNIKYTLILLLISMLTLNGCQTEQYNEFDRVGEIIELEDGKLLVPIALELPVYSVIETKAVGDEPIVKNIRVVVYDASGNVIQCVEGKIGSTNNKIEAILQRYNNPCSIQVFANIPDRLLPSFKIEATSEQINNLILETSDLTVATTAGIPVLSEAKELQVLDPVNIANYTASLKYACARIDITCSAAENMLSEVTLINAAIQSTLGENTSSVDLGGEEQRRTLSVSNNKIEKIYIFENSEVKEGTTEKNTTDLILKIDNGFYKICITHTDESGKDVYSIRRGYKYNVVINAVKGSGYMTFDEAKNNKPANISYEITVDDGRSKDIITSNGAYYLGVTNSEFYIFADEAKGVTVTYLSHNAPSTVTNATVTVSGAGITLRASEGYTVTTPPIAATLNLKNGAVQNLPLKLDMTTASTNGTLIIRIGDLVNEIKIVKNQNNITQESYKISDVKYTGSDFKTFTSLSDRLKISGKDLIMDNRPIYPDRNRVFAYATAFAGETRKNVLIAVKRPAQEVVYYEKYTDGTYGFCFQDGSCSSLDMTNKKTINQSGYGVVNLSKNLSANISFEDDGTRFISFEKNKIDIDNIFVDYHVGSLYGIIQDKNMNMETFKSSKSHLVIFDNKPLNQYVFPFLANGVYGSFKVEDGYSEIKPLIIRTAEHFMTMHYVKILPEDRNKDEYYKQEHDIDFKNKEFKTNIHIGENRNNFNGGGNKIRNLKFNNLYDAYMSIFEKNYGVLKNIHLINCYMVGGGSSGLLTGINYGIIENIVIEDCYVQGGGSNIGYISGQNIVFENGGIINNCMILGDSRENAKSVLRNYYSYTGGVTGYNGFGANVSNICIVDKNTSMNVDCSIIFSNNYFDFLGGIVGHNSGNVSNTVFIGRYPCEDGIKWPITGGYINAIKSFYTDYPSLTGELRGGGEARSIGGFGIENLDTDYWVKDDKFPFPRLKSLPIPTSWPVAN